MSDANNDPIGKALGIQSNIVSSTAMTVQNMLIDAHDDSARSDFESARANIHQLIEQAQESIIVLQEIAASSQNPRAFEVLAKLMDTVREANKDLMLLQGKIRELKNVDEPQNAGAKTINNNLFVGSTAELQKMIKDMNSGTA